MTDGQTNDQNRSGDAVAQAAWIRVFGGAVRGLTHSLGNRLHALEMTLGGFSPGDAITASATSALDTESAGCAELVRLYRLLPVQSNATPEACRVADVLPDAIELFRHHIDGRDVTCEVHALGEPPAVLVAPVQLTHALLVLFCDAVTGRDESEAQTIPIRVSGEHGSTRIDVRARQGAAEDGAEAVVAASWLLRQAYAEVSRIDGPTGSVVRIVLPSLTEARKRERERAPLPL